jgi:hypothetical protein
VLSIERHGHQNPAVFLAFRDLGNRREKERAERPFSPESA